VKFPTKKMKFLLEQIILLFVGSGSTFITL